MTTHHLETILIPIKRQGMNRLEVPFPACSSEVLRDVRKRASGVSVWLKAGALLGLGDIYRQRGQLELAERIYLEAKACIERSAIPGGIQLLAEVDLRLASLASLLE